MALTPSFVLFSAQAAIAASLPVTIPFSGDYYFAVNGAFGGCTVALEILGPDGTNYINCGTSATLTAAGTAIVTLPKGAKVRANLTGGAAMSIYAELKGVN